MASIVFSSAAYGADDGGGANNNIVLLTLHGQGKVNLEDPLGKYISGRNADNRTESAGVVNDLLSGVAMLTLIRDICEFQSVYWCGYRCMGAANAGIRGTSKGDCQFSSTDCAGAPVEPSGYCWNSLAGSDIRGVRDACRHDNAAA